MKKRIIAMGLAVVMTLSMSMTAFAASSTTSANSGNQETTVEKAAPGGAVAAETVSVAVVSANGAVSATSLDAVVKSSAATIVASAASAENVVATVQSLLTTNASPVFTQTIAALSQMKGTQMVVNTMGTVKTASVAKDALGNTIASAGVIKNVTSGALVMLMSVNADGTVEYVEGIVDPVTGVVMGAFQGVPSVITVLVLA